jgi:hypothetical protein
MLRSVVGLSIQLRMQYLRFTGHLVKLLFSPLHHVKCQGHSLENDCKANRN